MPDIYRLDHESFFYVEVIVTIYSAKIVENIKLSKQTSDTKTEEVEIDYDNKANSEKAKLNNKQEDQNLPSTYVKLTYSNIEVSLQRKNLYL